MTTKRNNPHLQVNPPVFFISGGLLVTLLVFGVSFTDVAQRVFSTLLDAVSDYFGWLYVIAVAFFIGFTVWLLLSRHANLRLGDPDERPQFSRPTWFSMLFSAGMGIGLVFYGVAEPMMHYANPPHYMPRSPGAAAEALPITFFHWGLHAWAIYALMALGIAYFAYRRKLPIALRSCFYPLFGEDIYGWRGHIIDILAVFGTLFGLATSLGLGSMQVSAGLHHVFGTSHSIQTQLTLIAVITMVATISLVTGVDKGIRRLSELNMTLAALLMLFVFFFGPTGFIIRTFVESIGQYATELFSRSLQLGALDARQGKWEKSWTLFYWGWWIAWSPFVGMFVARISRGRTIREFILGVLLVPSGVTFIWFSVFGGTSLHLELNGSGAVAQAVSHDVATAIYVMLEQLPLSSVTALIAAAVVAVFFVTSSDSASFVVDMLTSGGHPDPPVWQRVFWASAEGACAAVLLYSGGKQALEALQAAVVSIGLPFCLVLIGLAISLVRGLRDEEQRAAAAPAAAAPLEGMPVLPTALEKPMKLERILVPVDFSGHSVRAVSYAFQLAELSGGETVVELLHVAAPLADYLPLDRWIFGEARDEQHVREAVREAAEEGFDAFIAELPAEQGEQAVRRIEIGWPSQTIVELSKKGDHDMIVMGTHGRTGADRAALGSVATRVVRGARCPVVTVS